MPPLDNRTRVKICGITRPEDAIEAARLGADAIGLVFYRKSPRWVGVEQAREIIRSLPPFVTSVGLFVDETAEAVRDVLDVVPLDLLQFHGDESPAFCESFARPYIKAIRMRDGVDLREAARRYESGAGLLLDAWSPGLPGGTGQRFDWDRVPRDLGRPIVLAGGIEPDNVAEAIATVRPFAIDCSSGVEAEKGIKDGARMAALMTAVRKAGPCG